MDRRKRLPIRRMVQALKCLLKRKAVDPQKEAADPLGSPKEEEVLPWRTKEAADPPPKTSKEESHHRGLMRGRLTLVPALSSPRSRWSS